MRTKELSRQSDSCTAPGIVRRSRHQPHAADRHRQRLVLSGERLRPHRARRPASIHHGYPRHTARWSATTGSRLISSFLHRPGRRRPNAPKRLRSETSTSTTIDHPAPGQAVVQRGQPVFTQSVIGARQHRPICSSASSKRPRPTSCGSLRSLRAHLAGILIHTAFVTNAASESDQRVGGPGEHAGRGSTAPTLQSCCVVSRLRAL
jgi:hypothetical protein